MKHPSCGQRDIRVHSQVALFIILTRVYHAFGPDVDVEVLEHELPRIEEFDKDLENWRRVWKPRLSECLPLLTGLILTNSFSRKPLPWRLSLQSRKPQLLLFSSYPQLYGPEDLSLHRFNSTAFGSTQETCRGRHQFSHCDSHCCLGRARSSGKSCWDSAVLT